MSLHPDALVLPAPLVFGVAAFLGACLGSFTNVLIYRLPRNRGVAAGRSHCPACEAQIGWYDNIPVLSWLLLRGRCRRCEAPISGQYPLVELAGAICAVVAVWRFGAGAAGLTAMLFLIDLLAIAVIDWRHMIIPHTLTIAGMVFGLGLAFFNGVGLPASLIGGLAGAGVILAVSYGYKLVRGQIGMGGGDVMLMGMVGTVLGAVGVGLVLFGGACAGSLFALVRGHGRPEGQSKLPFGTFLALAAVATLFGGEALVDWYLGFLRQ